MKTLALDLGNSTLFAGVFRDGQLLRSRRFEVGRDGPIPATNLAKFVRTKIDRVAICSVVPDRTIALVRWVRDTLALEARVLTATSSHGLKIAYRHPARLGADRVAAALGARQLYPRRNLIVVDCGTATTVTVTGRDGTLHGGAILPGLGLWPEMLNRRTAQLPEVRLAVPPQVVATDTAAALRSGIVVGHAGAIRELVTRSRAEVFGRQAVTVLGTGGMATVLKGQSLFTAVEPALILHGLDYYSRQSLAHA